MRRLDHHLFSLGMKHYSCQYHPYQHPFPQPLLTRYGLWSVRQGLILTLTDDLGNVGQGEIAPLAWFGSETWAQAWDYCQQLPPRLTATDLLTVPDHLPACQFGFGCAWATLTQNPKQTSLTLPICALLPTGSPALSAYAALWQQGYRTFKWKIGVDDPETERKLLQELTMALPAGATLRLDANGGLTYESACEWLDLCDQLLAQVRIEYLEQPLPPDQFTAMLKLTQHFQTALALDESVATLGQLQACYQQGWRGVFVIKPAICGYPDQLREFCRIHPLDAVFSSVFESEIGRQACLQLATELSNPQRAIGFGVDHFCSNHQSLNSL